MRARTRARHSGRSVQENLTSPRIPRTASLKKSSRYSGRDALPLPDISFEVRVPQARALTPGGRQL
jgi:hypothetical protein